MKRIAYVVPGTGLDRAELARRQAFLNQAAGNDVRVEILVVKHGPLSIESFYDEYLAVPETLNVITEAERTGFNAAIIGCFGDPGLDAARELVRMPVVGPAEASMLLACTLGFRFSILTILPNVLEPMRRQVRSLGLHERFASVRSIDIPVLELRRRATEAHNALSREGQRAVEQDGAHVLILGCMSEGFLGVAEEIARAVQVPVVNPVTAAVKHAELLLALRLSHSPRAYPSPPLKAPLHASS